MKFVFLGVPRFASIILENLIQAGFTPDLIITTPDKPVGRKHIITPPPVKLAAQSHGIAMRQPKNKRELKEIIAELNPDLAIVAAYGRLIPKEILEIPKLGFLNVHPSILPRWRGAAPIQYTILNGDSDTGVTIIKMDEIIDHGPILAVDYFKVDNPKIDYPELEEKLANLGAGLLAKTISPWIDGKITPIPQNDSQATYTDIIEKGFGRIDWAKPAEEIDRQVRAYTPWPGTFTLIDSAKILKIYKATILAKTNVGPFGEPGKTYLASDDRIAVSCGKDFLIIEELQLEGGKKMAAKDFLLGHPDFIGITLT